MKQSKQTKRALLTSVLAMLLCLTMLVGSTFAWFTDSVTTGVNKIVAGNLDVELYAKKTADTEYAPVTAETNLFLKDALWEPGHVEVINLKVANLGTLALEYQLGVNVVSETTDITNANGGTFKLSDYIQFAVIEGEKTYTAEQREQAIKDAEDNSPVELSKYADTKGGVLYPATATDKDSEKLITLIVYMPTSVGNEANYRGEKIPQITLGVELVAKQTPYEKDSFDTDYDVEAVYPTPVASNDELAKAIDEAKDGDVITLEKDVDLMNGALVVDKDVTIDLAGNTLTTTNWLAVADAGKEVTIKNGEITATYGAQIKADAKLTLENVTMNVDNWALYGAGGDITVKNSTINSDGYGVMCFDEGCDVTIEDSEITAVTFGLYQNGSYAPGTYTLKNTKIVAAQPDGSESVGVYVSNSKGRQLQTLVIENCEISGSTAVEVKHTNLTISGGTLTATNPTKSNVVSGNGSCTTGYKVAVTTNKADETSTGTVTISDIAREDLFIIEGCTATLNGETITDFNTYGG